MRQTEENFSGAGSEPVPGAVRSPIHEVSPAELLAVPPRVGPQREGIGVPVEMEEFQRLQEDAQQPAPTDTEAEAATVDATPEEEDVDADEALAVFNAPEAGSLADLDLDAVAAAAPVTRVFEGNRFTNAVPPDHAIAVGPNHFLVAVNTELQAFNKQTGAPLFLPWALSSFFGPVMPPGTVDLFDPRVAYDHYAQRWIVVADAARANPPGSWIMVGVSQGTDPGGAYWVWALDATLDGSTPTSNWASYSMLGFDSQGIYISSNMRAFPFPSGTFRYAKLRILHKGELYAGGAAFWYDFWDGALRNPDNSRAFTVQPATHFHDAGVGANPDAYLVNALFPGGNTLTLWTLTDPIGFRAGRTPSLTRVAVPCLSYSQPPQARQPGTTVRLGGSNHDTRLQNAVYQELSFVGRRLWTCQTSAHTWGGDIEARSVVQWYEIDVPSQTVLQQARYGASGRYYFFPAIQTDAFGNAYLVFGSSSANGVSRRADLRQTGRQRTDETDLLQPSTRVKGGEASFTRGGGRWGDYYAMARDGGEPRIVWGYGSFANHGNQWGTRVFSTNFSGLP